MSHCISIVCACCGPVGLFRVGCSADVLHYSDILMVVMCPTPIPQMNISHLRVWDSPLLETSIACILKASFKEYVYTHIYIYILQGVCMHTHIYSYAQRRASSQRWDCCTSNRPIACSSSSHAAAAAAGSSSHAAAAAAAAQIRP
jgi:hypothetical protein